MGGTSRMTGDGHVRICERPGVKLPRPTRLMIPQAAPAESYGESENRLVEFRGVTTEKESGTFWVSGVRKLDSA